MPVREVKNGMAIKPNHVYVIPPNANMDLAQGKLRLTPRGKHRAASVDHFFCSLAREHQNLRHRRDFERHRFGRRGWA